MTAMVGCRALRVGACLSLTGRYSRFGVQAAHGLAAWRVLDGHAELLIVDDGSDPALTYAGAPRLVGAVAAGVHAFGQGVTSAEGVFGIAQWFPGLGTIAELGPPERDFLRSYSGQADMKPDYPAVQAAVAAVLATHCARATGSTTRESLWAAAAGLRTSTMFGAFRIDPDSGEQLGHETALVRWTADGLARSSPAFRADSSHPHDPK